MNDDLADIAALEALSDCELADIGITRAELTKMRERLSPPIVLIKAWHESGEEDLAKLASDEFTRIIDRLFS